MTPLSPQAVDWARSQIGTSRAFIYLNSGYTGPSPKGVGASIRAWTRGWYKQGLTTPEAVQEQERVTERARARVATLLACDADEVALTDNTSHGISVVAAGLDWKAGDEIVTDGLEHPSGLLPWFMLKERWGVVVESVPLPPGADPLEALAGAITPRTKLVCVSHVMYCTGMLVPVERLAALAHEAGALILVDGAQAAGNLPLDVGAMGCDFYAVPGQKWLLGPPGTGALYVRKGVQGRVWPCSVGWNTVDSFQMDGCMALRPSARRYEPATQPYGLLAGLGAALAFAEGLGREAIYGRIQDLVAHLRSRLQEVPGLTLVDPGPWGPSALVCFKLDSWDPQRVVDRLLEGWRIVCRSISDPPGLRACPHFFNTEEELDTPVEALGALAAEG